MRPGRFFWKLFLGNAFLVAFGLTISVWLIVGDVESGYRNDLTKHLLAEALTLRRQVRDDLARDDRAQLQLLADDVSSVEGLDVRVTVVASDGTVFADSDADPAGMSSHADRPEIIQALAEGWGAAERWSDTVHRELKYVAVRVDGDNGPLGMVRVAMPVRGIAARTDTMRKVIWRTAVVGLIVTVLLALGLAYVWSNPVRRITEAARSLSEGDLGARMEVSSADEIGQLATSLNQMRESLSAQLQTIETQRKNLQHIIGSLSEGVIVAGPGGRIALINQAARRLLNLRAAEPPADEDRGNGDPAAADVDPFVGLQVEQCVPQPELRALLAPPVPDDSHAGDSEPPTGVEPSKPSRAMREVRIQVDQPGGAVHLLARGSDVEPLRLGCDDDPAAPSRLVVLTDITELTQTIRMKSDFVANASHELRTPLSTIRASVETLQLVDGAAGDDAFAHFLDVISRHTTRLEELIGDLLALSRLESGSAEFPPEDVDLPLFLEDLHGRFAASLRDKDLQWRVDCAAESRVVRANPRLLRLVLDNLIANAVKFTPVGGHIGVFSRRERGVFVIETADDGCGIPLRDRNRVFERFYQVERARSGGGHRGTGLGLSIVRHAVAAMGGTVLLQGGPGEGTHVVLQIPEKSFPGCSVDEAAEC